MVDLSSSLCKRLPGRVYVLWMFYSLNMLQIADVPRNRFRDNSCGAFIGWTIGLLSILERRMSYSSQFSAWLHIDMILYIELANEHLLYIYIYTYILVLSLSIYIYYITNINQSIYIFIDLFYLYIHTCIIIINDSKPSLRLGPNIRIFRFFGIIQDEQLFQRTCLHVQGTDPKL